MKRELLVAAGVLLPFAVLVAVGFHYSGRPPPEKDVPLEPVVAPPVENQRAPALPQVPEPTVPAPFRAVMPEINQCFRDHLKAAHPVQVRVTPTAAGGFEAVQVDEQNPYLEACLVDVFAEGRWTPDGTEALEPIHYTFSFDASKD